MCIKGVEQSLQDILKAKDERVAFQRELLEKYSNPIISYKLNIPGPVKYNPLIKNIFNEGLLEITKVLEKQKIETSYQKITYQYSGPECFISFKYSPLEVKNLCTLIEEIHPLGRLFDFDILDEKGSQISREDKDMNPRKCLVCDKNAFECGRSRNHELKELLTKIENMATDYFKNK
ncbi:citrate lyase holo-[Clostridium sp. D2Q-11]|uniref:citrate lyase holo-[acyl-carrier protein] synthase n=1 Tax=Anaeromonas frigoriresistens TaxID=2683708 RepID=A0A942Z912_9FIRM|nr:citrate lyase holo-[acyl-carrier protein] synthase [Anaeromonas frigoriresistens]MBS4538415.1 citrate lyase holo-[acyl-carrier protein] synthase [Anaeromonas frigoriresistens]